MIIVLSDIVETNIDSVIAKYGATVTIQRQTASYDTFDQRTPGWTNSTTVSTNAVILPPSGSSGLGEEFQYKEAGAIQEADYIAFFKAGEVLEESSTTATAVRYIVVFNAQNYEINQLKPVECQDNVVMKRAVLRLITE